MSNKDDCISRQMAIDLFPDDGLEYDTKGGYVAPHLARQMICELPFVQPDHNADVSKKVERTDETAQNTSSCAHENNDVIFRKMAIEALARMMPRSYTPDGSHPADEEIFRAQEVFADCIEALEILPSAQPEIIRCKDCKYMIDIGGDLMCDNAKRWVVATTSDFGCVLAERRTE